MDFKYGIKNTQLGGYTIMYGATIYCSPTGNCQIFSIAEFCHVLSNYSRNDIKEMMRYLYTDILGKPLLLIDINDSYEEKVDAIFKDYIKSKTPYISSNDSEMIIYLINIRNIK